MKGVDCGKYRSIPTGTTVRFGGLGGCLLVITCKTGYLVYWARRRLSIISSVPRNTLPYYTTRFCEYWKAIFPPGKVGARYKLPDPYLESLIPRVSGYRFLLRGSSILIILVCRPGFNADEFFNGNKDGS